MTTTGRDIKTGIYGVLGHDIGYSLSPSIFRTVFASLGWPAVYGLFDLAPRQLQGFLQAVPHAQIRGLSVTKPHKTAVIRNLDRLDPVAKAIGAVNTITLRNGNLIGHNTDVAGVVAALSPVRRQLRSGNALIFGAGGAARAVAFALHNEFGITEIAIAARSSSKAHALVRHLQNHLSDATVASARFTPAHGLHDAVAGATLVVNATPLGGVQLRGRSPLPHGTALRRKAIVFDLNYIPSTTGLMRQARHTGCRHFIGGWPMLVAQADAAFHLWTGRHFPRAVYRQLLRQQPKP